MIYLGHLLDEGAAPIGSPDDQRMTRVIHVRLVVAGEGGHELPVVHLERIVRRNVMSGRFARAMRRGYATGFEDYIANVVTVYLREYPRVARLVVGDVQSWSLVFKRLTRQAFGQLTRHGWPAGHAREEAQDCAQASCEIVARTPFPFDAPFDAWSALILHNAIRQHQRSREVLNHPALTLSLQRLSLDGREDELEEPRAPDVGGEAAFRQIEWQDRLVRLADQLPSLAQRQVVLDTFLGELEDEDIARRLGRTRNAVHILRHRALRRLGPMWDQV